MQHRFCSLFYAQHPALCLMLNRYLWARGQHKHATKNVKLRVHVRVCVGWGWGGQGGISNSFLYNLILKQSHMNYQRVQIPQMPKKKVYYRYVKHINIAVHIPRLWQHPKWAAIFSMQVFAPVVFLTSALENVPPYPLQNHPIDKRTWFNSYFKITQKSPKETVLQIKHR